MTDWELECDDIDFNYEADALRLWRKESTMSRRLMDKAEAQFNKYVALNESKINDKWYKDHVRHGMMKAFFLNACRRDFSVESRI
jgi:hypothetical protein